MRIHCRAESSKLKPRLMPLSEMIPFSIVRVPFSTTNLVLVGKSVTGATLVAVLPRERPRRHPKAFGTPFHFIVRDPPRASRVTAPADVGREGVPSNV
jgi:hypothetical protein